MRVAKFSDKRIEVRGPSHWYEPIVYRFFYSTDKGKSWCLLGAQTAYGFVEAQNRHSQQLLADNDIKSLLLIRVLMFMASRKYLLPKRGAPLSLIRKSRFPRIYSRLYKKLEDAFDAGHPGLTVCMDLGQILFKNRKPLSHESRSIAESQMRHAGLAETPPATKKHLAKKHGARKNRKVFHLSVAARSFFFR